MFRPVNKIALKKMVKKGQDPLKIEKKPATDKVSKGLQRNKVVTVVNFIYTRYHIIYMLFHRAVL